MKSEKFYIIIIFLFFSLNVSAQTAHRNLRDGNNAYAQGHFNKSEEKYRKAVEEAAKNKAKSEGTEALQKSEYNLGNAIYQQKRFEEAAKKYQQIIDNPNLSRPFRADALHNLGNAQFEQKQFDKAIASYRKSLEIRPNDQATKQNLANAIRQKKQQHQQKQENKENKDQDKGQNKENQDKKPEKKENNPKNDTPPVSKIQSEQMLQIMNEEERKVQQRMLKGKPSPKRNAKDW